MATYYLQQVLSMSGLAPPLTNTTSPEVASNSTSSPSPLPTMPADIGGLVTLLLSFSGLREWLKIFLLGGVFETCRRFFSYLYLKIQENMYITAYFEEDDSSYDWIMVWLSKQPSWAQSRDVQVSTETYGNSGTAVLVDTSPDENSALVKSTKRLTYLPSLSRTYSMWYKRRWMTITRTQEQTGWYGTKERTLHISIMTRSNKLLLELLQEARNAYLASQEHSMCVFVSDINNNWRHVACRKKRALRSVVLDPGVKDLLLEDARDFLDSKEWYAERGIPFRRGYLLYGEPGCGKTSLIHCLAGELNLDVYVISLSRTGLDDSALDQLVNDLPERCLALMEDVDAAFSQVMNRDDSPPTKEGDSKDNAGKPPPGTAKPPPPPTSKITLSGLLNALDGVSAQEGRILVATTNKYTSLDPALCRPGRMDLHIEFRLASKYQARELFSRFYLPGDTVKVGEDVEEEEVAEKEEKESVDDSGYASSVENADSLPSQADSKPKPTSNLLPDSPPFTGSTHKGRGPALTRRQVHTLAEQFAEIIPERELSMAALQGYLMSYKIRPYQAVKDAADWVEKQRKEKTEKKKKEEEERLRKEKERLEQEEKEKKEKEEKEKKEKEEKEKKEQEEKEKKEKEDKDKKAKEEEKEKALS